jgi:quinoprotein glucose dehydrogenase
MAVIRRLAFLALLIAAVSWPFTGRGQTGAKNGEWRAYSAEEASTRYSPADQITRDNVKQLEVAWTWRFDNYGSAAQTATTETTPLMIGGKLYFTAGQRRTVVAADAGTGETLWTWRPDEGARFDAAPRKVHRGVAYWSNGQEERIVVVTPGFQLVSLDAKTGRPVQGFGQAGIVDLFKQLDLDVPLDPTGRIGNSSPPVISNDVIVVGPALTPGGRVNISNVKGDIMGFDVRTGRKLWTFHTVPREGEPGIETWLGDSAQYTGNAGVWGPFSADPALGYVYLSVESATNDVYGGHRPGNNLYSDSLICLDIKTGKMIWFQQLVHHDIWDYDMPPHPILVDLTVDGKPVKAVVQLTKQAFAYVFDRTNGRPVFGWTERPVPQTDVPKEWTAPTQPFPNKPPAFDQQGITHEDLIDFTPALRAEAIKALEQYKIGPIYTPGTVVVEGKNRGTIVVPGLGGGANWPGGAADPETGFVYVGSTTTPGVIGLTPNTDQKTSGVDTDYTFGGGLPTIQGLRLMKPPYGRITAYNMNKGEIAWQIPNGDTPPAVKNNPALKGLNIPKTGSPSQAGLLVTKTLLFAGEGSGGQAFFHAYDKATGAEIWQTPIPGPQTSLPMTYMHQNRQFVVVGVRGPTGQGAQLMAFALPRDEPAGRGGRGGRGGAAGGRGGANPEN